MKHTRIALVVPVAALGSSACGSSSSSSAATTTTLSACAAKTDLQQSLTALANPSTLTSGKSSITNAADDVEKNLDALGGRRRTERHRRGHHQGLDDDQPDRCHHHALSLELTVTRGPAGQ